MFKSLYSRPGINPHDIFRVDSGLSGSQNIGVIGPHHTPSTLTPLPMCPMALLDMCSHSCWVCSLRNILSKIIKLCDTLLGIDPGLGFLMTTFSAVLWELVENSEFVINLFRENSGPSENYRGDSQINVVGDILSCSLGYGASYIPPLPPAGGQPPSCPGILHPLRAVHDTQVRSGSSLNLREDPKIRGCI